jgi:hypothetical protein
MGSYRPKAMALVRVVNEDNCGTPVDDEAGCGYYNRRCNVSVTWEEQVEDPVESLLRCDDGEVEYYDRSDPAYKFSQVTLVTNGIDPQLQTMMMGYDAELDAQTNELVGARQNAARFGKKFFGFEAWAQVASGPSTPACPGGEQRWAYLLFPFCKNARWATVPTYGQNTDTVGIMFDALLGGNWEDGPFDVVPDINGDPGPLTDPMLPEQAYLMRTTRIAPPAPTAECMSLSSPTSP